MKATTRIAADLRRGWRASFDDLVVAALVALPFSGSLAIWISWLTWWPSVVLIPLTGLLQGVLTFWIAGMRHRGERGGDEPHGGDA